MGAGEGVKGQIALVPKSEGETKSPGPNQRFKAGASLRKLEQATGDAPADVAAAGTWTRRSPRRTWQGRVRSCCKPDGQEVHARGQVSVMGAKQKSSR